MNKTRGIASLILAVLLQASLAGDAEAARRALLIGVNRYQNLPHYSARLRRPMSNLRGAVNDVRAVSDALSGRFGFDKTSILTLVDDQATRDGIFAAIRAFLINGTREGDVVVLYFSGHGAQVPDQNGDEDDGLDEALCPYDLVPTARTVKESQVILDDELGALLAQLTGRTVLVIVDACHSGTITRSIGSDVVAELEDTPAVGPPKAVWLDELFSTRGAPPAAGRVTTRWTSLGAQLVLTSSRAGQASVEIAEPGGMFHGAFTRALLEAMSTLPRPSYRDLYTFARRVVSDRYRLPQDPELTAASEGFADTPAFAPSVASSAPPARPVPTPAVISPPASVARPPAATGKPPVSVVESAVSTAPSPAAIRPPAPSAVPMGRPPGDSRPGKEPASVLLSLDVAACPGGDLGSTLSTTFSALPYVTLTHRADFDRLLRGRPGLSGPCEFRLLSPAGDAVRLSPAALPSALLARVLPFLEYAFIVKQLEAARPSGPALGVRLGVAGGRRDFRLGEKLVLDVTADDDCYLWLFNADSTGSLHMLFPNRSSQDNALKAGSRIELPTRAMRANQFELEFSAPAGEEAFILLATSRPLALSGGDGAAFNGVAGGRPLAATSPARERVRALLGMLADATKVGGLRWGTDIIVVRSY